MKKWLRRIGIGVFALLLLVIAGVAIAYWTMSRETGPLDAAARKRLGGAYVTLASGVTHYKWSGQLSGPGNGPASGPVVVLIHGGTVPFWSWDAQMPALIKAGFRVLRYDQYGRGYSDRVPGPYDRSLYARQLKELLDKLGVKRPVDLVGTSFGGAVAAHFTSKHPERVRRLVLIAPLVNSVENNTIELLRLPVLGPVLLRLIGIRTLENRGASFFKIAPDPARLMRLYSEQFTWAGTETALMSFLSTDALGDYRPDYKRAGAGRPVLIVRGTADREITAAMMADARRAIPHARYVSLKGIGHGAVLQAAGRVNALIIGFLKK